MYYGIQTPLLPFLGACLYGDAAAYYGGLSESERAELETQGKESGLTAWFYRYLYDVLPAEKRAEYQKIYQSRQIKAIMGAQELKRLYRVLSSHKLRFVPIKGADMAYRLYSDTALRAFIDWDIWFHPDDCDLAIEVLKEDGWSILEFYSDEHDGVMKTVEHHFSPHVRGPYIVEPHCTLAHFEGADPREMWAETVECPGGDGQRVLSPEMNLLMHARHAAGDSYYHAQLPKLLADAAVVMQKETIDFEKLRSLAARWRLPYPGDLLAAFPEFFPSSEIAKFGADPQKTAEFRQIFELRGETGRPSTVALTLSRFEMQEQMTARVLNHIFSLKPYKIRCIFHLPKHGAWGRVAWAYVRYFLTRTWRVLAIACLPKKSKQKKYLSLVEKIESNTHAQNDTERPSGPKDCGSGDCTR